MPPEREVLLPLLLPPEKPPERLVVEPLERKFDDELLLRCVVVVPRLVVLLPEDPLFTVVVLRVG